MQRGEFELSVSNSSLMVFDNINCNNCRYLALIPVYIVVERFFQTFKKKNFFFFN